MDSLLALTSAFTTVLSDFHFLRPLWLLLLAPTPILLWLLKQRAQRTSAWQQVIDHSLHSVMLEQDNGITKKSVLWPYWAIAWLIAVIALAGPVSVKTNKRLLFFWICQRRWRRKTLRPLVLPVPFKKLPILCVPVKTALLL